MRSKNKLNKSVWLRLALSLILIIFVSTKIEVDRLTNLLSSMRLSFFFLALLLVIPERAMLAYKWNVLLATKKMSLPFLTIFKICYLGNFIGTFFPSSLGVDVVRVYSLYKYNSNAAESISSVFVERWIGLFSVLTLVPASMLLFSETVANQNIFLFILIPVIFFIACSVVLLNKSIMRAFITGLNSINLPSLQRNLQDTYRAFSEYAEHKLVLLYVLILSFVLQVTRILITYFVYLSIGNDVNIVYFFIIVPLVIVLTMLPIAVAGIGIREGAFVYFFSQVGMSASEAFTLSILVYALVMISIMPGGIIYVLEGLQTKPAFGDEYEPLFRKNRGARIGE
jgi:uncharacterized protein (TIRG00374 family)